jgi:DNA-binding NarL/FixJ family response regulator
MARKLRVYLADDHAVVREGLRALIDRQPDMEVIGEAGDGRTALEQSKELRPDVVVMDISMPEPTGTAATERLRAAAPDVKVLALTVHEDKGYLRQLLQAGASGYILKRAAATELVHALRTVASGGLYLDPAVAQKVVGGFLQQPSARGAPQGGDLSERELDVLRLIAEGHTNKEIAARLEISVKTVETYKARSMEKLGLENRAAIVAYAVQQGWLQRI